MSREPEREYEINVPPMWDGRDFFPFSWTSFSGDKVRASGVAARDGEMGTYPVTSLQKSIFFSDA